MSVTKEPFGITAAGIEVERYCLNGKGGLQAYWITYGATLQSLLFQGKDLVLGYDTVSDYEAQNQSYQGATIGRYGNRIANGKFTLNGVEYRLCCNEKDGFHLHGGAIGFDKKIWNAEILSEDEPAVRFTMVSPDGDEGYPGRLAVSVTVTVTSDNRLHIDYTATSDADTIVNLTNHAYFNLNGADGGDVLDTELTVYADHITPTDADQIPTGELMPVVGTPFDFTAPKPIGKEIDSDHPQILLGDGYDHNFVLSNPIEADGLRHAATATSPRSGITLKCYTTEPSVQLYTANGLDETAGKYKIPLYRRQGFCLETQHAPDSPNQPSFPSTVLKAGECYYSKTVYAFH